MSKLNGSKYSLCSGEVELWFRSDPYYVKINCHVPYSINILSGEKTKLFEREFEVWYVDCKRHSWSGVTGTATAKEHFKKDAKKILKDLDLNKIYSEARENYIQFQTETCEGKIRNAKKEIEEQTTILN